MTVALTEAWTALRTSLMADATLTALLADATQFYWSDPPITPSFPCIVGKIRSENPVGDNSFVGEWRPDVDLLIYATDPRVCAAISARLLTHSRPIATTSPILGTNLQITQFHQVNAMEAPPLRVVDTGELVHVLATDWRLHVKRRSV